MSSRCKRHFGERIVVSVRRSPVAQTRLGITVTKRFGNACQRNYFKRIVREAFRSSRHTFPTGMDILVKPGRGALRAKMLNVTEELVSLVLGAASECF
ncbi:MAG: Ribonuclease P protein component [Chlamydiae bacterium]|nr:Ribonuclease P protein component [Chlamydiota bacterium]